MDIKEVAIGLYQSMLDTNKSFGELATACKRSFARQNQINKNLAVSIICLIGYAAYSEFRHKQVTEKIEQLSNDIKELRGETEEDQCY